MPDQSDALSLLHDQHEQVSALFVSIERMQISSPTDSASGVDRRKIVADEIIAKLSMHAAIEEEYFYPELAKVLPDGDPLAQNAIDEHQEVKQLLHQIDGMSPDHVEFPAVMGKIVTEVRKHVGYEESQIFPKLRAALPAEDLVRIGQTLLKAELTAPSHPHPHGPNTPPANRLANKGAGLLDKLRDVVTGRKA